MIFGFSFKKANQNNLTKKRNTIFVWGRKFSLRFALGGVHSHY